MNQFTALTMPYSACQQASQNMFDDAVRVERIFLRYEPKVVSSDSCTYTYCQIESNSIESEHVMESVIDSWNLLLILSPHLMFQKRPLLTHLFSGLKLNQIAISLIM